MYKFILLRNGDHETKPEVMSSGTFRSEEDMLDHWCQQKGGWVPDHIENAEGHLPIDSHPDTILAYSKDMTCQRLGIGCERNEDLSDEYLLIRVDLETADVDEYPIEE